MTCLPHVRRIRESIHRRCCFLYDLRSDHLMKRSGIDSWYLPPGAARAMVLDCCCKLFVSRYDKNGVQLGSNDDEGCACEDIDVVCLGALVFI